MTHFHVHQSLNSGRFKDFFLDYFKKIGDTEVVKKLATIDWETWFHGIGMPPGKPGRRRERGKLALSALSRGVQDTLFDACGSSN